MHLKEPPGGMRNAVSDSLSCGTATCGGYSGSGSRSGVRRVKKEQSATFLIDRESSNKSTNSVHRNDGNFGSEFPQQGASTSAGASATLCEKLKPELSKWEEDSRSYCRRPRGGAADTRLMSPLGLLKEETSTENNNNIDAEMNDLTESALAKLKRKIRLKLLAEEAKNTCLHLFSKGAAGRGGEAQDNINTVRRRRLCSSNNKIVNVIGEAETGQSPRIIGNAFQSIKELSTSVQQQQQQQSYASEGRPQQHHQSHAPERQQQQSYASERQCQWQHRQLNGPERQQHQQYQHQQSCEPVIEREQHHAHQRQQQSPPSTTGCHRQQSSLASQLQNSPLSGQLVRVQGQTVVDLSSESEADEADVPDLSLLQFQKQQEQQQQQRKPLQHQKEEKLKQQVQQETYENQMLALPESLEREVYKDTLAKLLRPLISKTAISKIVQRIDTSDITNLELGVAPMRKKPGPKPGSKRRPKTSAAIELGSPIGTADALVLCRNPVSTSAGRGGRGGRGRRGSRGGRNGSSDYLECRKMIECLGEICSPATEYELHHQHTTTEVIHPRESKEKNEQARLQVEYMLTEYEVERENNIRRNKAFLQGLELDSSTEGITTKSTFNNPGGHYCQPVGTAKAILTETYRHIDQEEILRRNPVFLGQEPLQWSPITSTFSGSSVSIGHSDRKPRLGRTTNYGTEDNNNRPLNLALPTTPQKGSKGRPPGSGSVRPPGRPRLDRGKTAAITNEPSSKARNRVDKETGAAISAAASYSNEEVIRLVTELLSSRNAGPIPPKLLTFEGAGEIVSAMKNKAAKKNYAISSDSAPEIKAKATPPPAASTQAPNKDVTGSSGHGPGPRKRGRKRKNTWLTTIPFETPKTEYELERDEVLLTRKNQFEKLGIVAELIEEPSTPRPIRTYSKRWTTEPNPLYNRQTRLRDRLKSARSGSVDIVMPIKEVKQEENQIESASEAELFVSSLVAQFASGGKIQDRFFTAYSERVDSFALKGSQILNFQTQENYEQCLDPFLQRIYTMDVGTITGFTSIRQNNSGLLAAGGSQGRIAIFALPDSEGKVSKAHDESEEGLDVGYNNRNDPRGPLLSWSVDSGWISQVLFLSDQFQENEMLFLSSSGSNDGKVILWDINQVRIQDGCRGLDKMGMPHVVWQTSTLHEGGISGMHELWGRLATSSADGVGISVIRETMIFMEKSITGHHEGAVIRNVRFRDKNVVADCASDSTIGILDLRLPDACVCKIRTAHNSSMSMIEWNPGSENVLLSASLDPQLYLHDIRSAATPFSIVMKGHMHPRRLKCYSVYRPTFVGSGLAVVTPGEGTHNLSLYSVATGCEIGKVHVGYDTTILLWNGLLPNQEGGLWAGSNGITQFNPVWRHSPPLNYHHHTQSSYLHSGPPSLLAPSPAAPPPQSVVQ